MSSLPSPNQEPRWLDEQERAAWINLMKVTIALPAALDRHLRAEAGIGHFDYLVMGILSESPEQSLRMTQIAELTEASLPRLSQLASRLERRGWLERRSHPEDGRSTVAVLTDEGLAALTEAAPSHVAEVRRLVFDSLTSTQITQLAKIAERIVQSADAVGARTCRADDQ